MNEKVHIFDHPLIQHKLSILRRETTGVKEFREIVGEIAMLMCYDATRDLKTKQITIKTPVADAKVRVLAGKKLAIVPILRAGLGMVDGLTTLIPSARVGHVGMYRDEETCRPVFYYYKMPANKDRMVIVTDPMLATGGSACDAITRLKEDGYKSIRLMCLVASPQGVKAVEDQHPDVDIYLAALDEGLNDKKYILPGLGDAGDRIFGTR